MQWLYLVGKTNPKGCAFLYLRPENGEMGTDLHSSSESWLGYLICGFSQSYVWTSTFISSWAMGVSDLLLGAPSQVYDMSHMWPERTLKNSCKNKRSDFSKHISLLIYLHFYVNLIWKPLDSEDKIKVGIDPICNCCLWTWVPTLSS